ncbi:DUF402 domain-containing protein [Paenibacillus sp. N3.4]|uniref:DUF402 domain-containing protein n=1 Tax=Paenibacillus sp. N3.4 TaxID=2603222 RepID=UPI0011CC5D76|nr:DUF402 domain-containing protein [Paenibacillus sp. N3.4]TXK83465.1 DUF402 domain-containing protein [Paenibacillus sp. N3.4]
MNSEQVIIRALKYGNFPHYEWPTTILEKKPTYIIVCSERGRKLRHHTKQEVFTMENWTLEFFSSELWFTVSGDVIDGKIVQYYCNINEPAIITDSLVTFVDLDLDLIQRNGNWTVVDEDEFVSHSVKYAYPESLIQRAKDELKQLQAIIQRKEFPFDGTMEWFIPRIPKQS